MATSSDPARLASSAIRPLTDDIFDSLREAVIVVDTSSKHIPVLLANAAARRCVFGDANAVPVVEASLYTLLGAQTDSVLAAALGTASTGKLSANRRLTWNFPRGEMQISTELKMLELGPGHPVVMLTFLEPTSEPLSEQGILSAIEQMPMDLLILDKDLTVVYANAGAARTAGSAPGELMSLAGMIIAPVSAVPREALTAALAGESFHDDAVAVTNPGVPTRWFEIDLQPLKDQSTIAGVAVLSMEVTERRRRRRASDGTEKRLSALGQNARDVISVTTGDGKFRYVSGGITQSLGYIPAERLSGSLFEHVHPEDLPSFRAKFSELASGGLESFSRQLRVRHRDGSYRWVELSCVSALDNPLIRGIVVDARDVTERKQAEARLAQREEVFKLAADAVNGIIFEWDLSRGVVHRSRGVYDVLGIEPKELERVGAWSARIHPDDSAAYEAQVAAALTGGRGWTAHFRIRNTHGRYRSVMERGLVQRSADGLPIRAIGCVVDVSEIKRLTDLLAQAQRAAQIGGWEYSYTTRELEWTEEMYRIYETRPEEFQISWFSMMAQCPPESRLQLNNAIETAHAGEGRLDLELEIVTLKGRRIWVRLVGQIEMLDGRPFRAFGSVQNIQEQKLAQIALENSTDWLKLSMNMADMHAWRWNRSADTLEFAIVDREMVHLPRVFPGMRKLMSRVHPKDRLAVRRAIDHAFERHTEVHKEFRLKSQDGRYRAYAAVARPLFDANNQPSGMVGVTQDVTSRHESQARLRRSEELLRATTANTADTLVLVDTDLVVRFINRAAFGLCLEEIVGREISVLLPEYLRDGLLLRLGRIFKTGMPEAFEFDFAMPSGETEYFEARAGLVRDDAIGTGISIAMRNITERKRLENEILEASSRERQAIGRDLHDGLGQELTGIALMLRGLATKLKGESPSTQAQVEEIVGLVNQSIDTARALARGLLPVSTDGAGLAGALRVLADRSRDLFGLTVDFRVKVSSERALSEATANHLYRIAQEAVTNTMRHARAQSVGIYLMVTSRKFLLRITDDGVGIPSSTTGPGMGLKIMKYRAGMIGANIEIGPNRPHGTAVCITGHRAAVLRPVESAQAM